MNGGKEEKLFQSFFEEKPFLSHLSFSLLPPMGRNFVTPTQPTVCYAVHYLLPIVDVCNAMQRALYVFRNKFSDNFFVPKYSRTYLWQKRPGPLCRNERHGAMSRSDQFVQVLSPSQILWID